MRAAPVIATFSALALGVCLGPGAAFAQDAPDGFPGVQPDVTPPQPPPLADLPPPRPYGPAVGIPGDPPPVSQVENRFWFGSYGRVGLSMNGDGGAGRPSQIVAFGPRLIEDNYLELDFGYVAWRGPEADVRVMTTLAFFDDFFHFTGQPTAALTIRQMFAEAENLWGSHWFAWAGSRWMRGNDIYLLNFWPMDELNVMGAATGWRDARSEFTVLFGLNRLENGLNAQRVPVPANDFGATDVMLLDRQKQIFAALYERRFGGDEGIAGPNLGFKLRLYGELHHLPSGRRALDDTFSRTEPLPDDFGFVLGTQFGMWNFGKRGHLNVWLRYAGGLAVYDELGTPFGLNADRRSVDARELRLAVAGNLESRWLAVQYGGYVRHFVDADPNEEDFDDRTEGSFVVRPQLNLGLFTPAVEASLQVSRPNGLNPRTLEQSVATVTQLALVPALTFADDPGSFSRPQIRFIYAVSLLNDAALAYYAERDPRSSQDVVHYLGIRAEWWFGRGGSY